MIGQNVSVIHRLTLGVKSVGANSKDLMVISLNFLGGAIWADSMDAALDISLPGGRVTGVDSRVRS